MGTWGNPAALWWLAALIVPLAIHLIGRRRAPVVDFAALEFLFDGSRLTAQRVLLRERWLLLVRVAMAALIALALAEPYVACGTMHPTATRGRQAAVLVIDDSYVAAARIDARTTVLQRLVATAKTTLESMGEDAEVAVVTVSQPQAPATPTRNHVALINALEALRPSAASPQLGPALARAEQLLSTSSDATRSVVVLSPLFSLDDVASQTSTAKSADHGISYQWLRAEIPQALDNFAITALAAESGDDLQMLVEVSNETQQAVTALPLELLLDEVVVARNHVSVGPRSTERVRFSLTLPAEKSYARVRARLQAPPGDRLASDDVRDAWVTRNPAPRILLVNGEPSLSRYADELYFAKTALSLAFPRQAPTAVNVGAFDASRLPRYDVVMLANPPPLPPPQVAALRQWVERGGGLLVTAGSQTLAPTFGDTMAPLLADRLLGHDGIEGSGRNPGTTAAGSNATAARSSAPGPSAPGAARQGTTSPTPAGVAAPASLREPLRLGPIDDRHPVFAGFSARDPSLMGVALQRRLLLAGAAGTQALWSFADGPPALVLAQAGRGRLALLATTIDRDWGNLPAQAGFAPLLAALSEYLAAKPRNAPGQIIVGQPVALPTLVEPAYVLTPSGTRHRLGREPFAATNEQGLYRVVEAGVAPRPDASFVANLDPRGARLVATPGPANTAPARASASPTAVPRYVLLAPWLLAAAVALMLVELAISANRRASA